MVWLLGAMMVGVWMAMVGLMVKVFRIQLAEWRAFRARAVGWAELTGGAVRRPVKVAGVVETLGGGSLAAPVTGTACVWWEAEGSAVGKGEAARRTGRRTSGAAFGVRTAEGVVAVLPEPGRLRGAEQSAGYGTASVRDASGRVNPKEWVLREGAALHVYGVPEPGPAGSVRLAGKSAFAAVPGGEPTLGYLLMGFAGVSFGGLVLAGCTAYLVHALLTA